jgi:hypothetical protein
MREHPEGPDFALSVGVTGHRPNKLSRAAVSRLDRQLRDMMTTIDRAVRARNPGQPVRLISGFAEGVDQMAVAAAPADWIVAAILPFPRAEYLKDFEQSAAGDGRDVRGDLLASLARAATVTELPTPRGSPREQGYLAAGRAMLGQIDLLIAVWDGEAAKTGGTGQIVREACDAGTPVIWLATETEREPVVIEHFAGDRPIASSKPWTTAVASRSQPS